MAKKKHIRIDRLFITIIVLLIIVMSPFSVPILLNNKILDGYAKQLYVAPLPPSTVLISKTKSVGNLNGTGSHLDFVAALKIKSYLSEDDLSAYYHSILIKSAYAISGKKLEYIDGVPHSSVKIEVIPMVKAQLQLGSSKIYMEGNAINNYADRREFIVQITDTHYAPGWDLRAHWKYQNRWVYDAIRKLKT